MRATAVLVTPCSHGRRGPVRVTVEEKSADGVWAAIATKTVDDTTAFVTNELIHGRPRRLIIEEIGE